VSMTIVERLPRLAQLCGRLTRGLDMDAFVLLLQTLVTSSPCVCSTEPTEHSLAATLDT
jgi:hypothetical protein